MTNRFAALFLAALLSAWLRAETPCPANVKAVPFQNSERHQIIVQVSINNAGPFDFLLDTGTQMTVVDQSLASELHISATGSANVAGMSFQGKIKFANLDLLKVGDHLSVNQRVLVYNMNQVHGAGFAIRGLLGEDFLSRYDVLIDNAHSVLCIDDTGAMEGGVKGTPYAGK